MSATRASRKCAASCLPCSITLSHALSSAVPPAIAEREPPVPPPNSSWSLSPCSSFSRSNGMPSRLTTTCAKGEAWPWP